MKRTLRKLRERLLRPVLTELEPIQESHRCDEAVAQKAIMQQYRLLASQGPEWLPVIQDVGFRKYSQFEEDGILLFIFSLIPAINRTCVEICAGNGQVCNTANLIINHGWWGHLFDGNGKNVKAGKAFFSKNRDTFLYPPRFTKAWITAENVNDLIAESGATGPIDVMSLDIDGMDFWIWKAITVIEPQVVVCEAHNLISSERALTVPYDPGFITDTHYYQGASLAAMCKLAREKGYRLIGTHRFGFNAFFMKSGIGEAYFPEVEIDSCLQDPYTKFVQEQKWLEVRDRAWQEV